jgi:hypothetical protein
MSMSSSPRSYRLLWGLFAFGVLALGWFKVGLLTGRSFASEAAEVPAGQLTAEREPVGAP